MSISNTTFIAFGNGDGVTLTFTFPFKIFLTTDLVVSLIQISTGGSTPQVLGTNYSVTINPVAEGGSITFVTAPPVGYQWYAQRVEPFTQSLAIPTEGAIPAQGLNNALDLLTMLAIQINGAVVQIPPLFTGTTPVVLPQPVAGLALAWDPTGKTLVNITPSSIGFLTVPITGANLVSGAALELLGNIPAGAGIVPVANLPTGVSAGDIILLNGSGKIPAVDGSLLTNVVAAVNANLNGNQFGAWKPYATGSTPWAFGTAYLAATDLLVTAQCENSGSAGDLKGITDANSSPSTVRVWIYGTGTGSSLNGITFPVRKGDYWQVTFGQSVSSGTIYVLPMGS